MAETPASIEVPCPACAGTGVLTGTLTFDLNVSLDAATPNGHPELELVDPEPVVESEPPPPARKTTTRRTPSKPVTTGIINFLEANPGTWFTVVNIGDRLPNCSPASVRKAISRLQADSRIDVRPDPAWNSKQSPTPRKQYKLRNGAGSE